MSETGIRIKLSKNTTGGHPRCWCWDLINSETGNIANLPTPWFHTLEEALEALRKELQEGIVPKGFDYYLIEGNGTYDQLKG